MKKNLLILFGFVILPRLLYSQPPNWTVITDNSTGITFSAPGNTSKIDSLYTTLYGAAIDSTEAVQVHIFKNANITNSDPVFNEALIEESNDTLRAIARIILLTTDSELTEIVEVNTNGIRGLEIGIKYNSLQTDVPYHTITRYYMFGENFVSFTWTAKETKLKSGNIAKDSFFNSVNL